MTSADNNLVGRIVLVVPSMQLIEIVAASRLLDFAMAEKLDMEGGKTGQYGHFRLSRRLA